MLVRNVSGASGWRSQELQQTTRVRNGRSGKASTTQTDEGRRTALHCGDGWDAETPQPPSAAAAPVDGAKHRKPSRTKMPKGKRCRGVLHVDNVVGLRRMWALKKHGVAADIAQTQGRVAVEEARDPNKGG